HAASGNRVNLYVIRNNGGFGILTDNGSNHNAWYYGSIYNNAQGGIAQPTNASPQPAPVITSVVTSAAGLTTITGTITGSPYANSNLVIQFYVSPPATGAAANQGLTFLGQINVTTDGNGNASFTYTPTSAIASGELITATA